MLPRKNHYLRAFYTRILRETPICANTTLLQSNPNRINICNLSPNLIYLILIIRENLAMIMIDVKTAMIASPNKREIHH